MPMKKVSGAASPAIMVSSFSAVRPSAASSCSFPGGRLRFSVLTSRKAFGRDTPMETRW